MSRPIIDTPENWDAASTGYAKYVAPVMMESFAPAIIQRLDVNDQTDALEIAAGSGALTVHLAPEVRSLRSIDFSPKMLAILKDRLDEQRITNVKLEEMDGQALDIPDDSYDRVASSFALMLFPDKAKGFREMRRVLHPGGKAVVSAWAGPDRFEAFAVFLKGMGAAFPDIPRPETPPPVFSLSDPEVFRHEMESAGFHDVRVEFETRELVIEDFSYLWSMLTVGAPPIKMLFEKIGEGGVAKLKDTLARQIHERFGDGPITLSNSATIGYGEA